MKLKRRALVLIAALVAGCATPPPPEPSAEQTEAAREAEEVLSLLAYYQRLLSMPPEELKREYQSANQAYGRDRSEAARLKLAMLLSVPGAAWHDDARLVTLLEGAVSHPASGDSPRRQLVTLLQRVVLERSREAKRLEAQVKEEQKRADELQRRAEELQQKLDAMLNIERNLQRGRR